MTWLNLLLTAIIAEQAFSAAISYFEIGFHCDWSIPAACCWSARRRITLIS